MRRTGEWQGYWEGRESTQWTESIRNLRRKIPMFTQEKFRKEEEVNKYKDLIVREPLEEVPEDVGYVEARTRKQIPIAAVSNNYRGHLFRGRKQGYKLVNHHELLDEVLSTFKLHSIELDAIRADRAGIESLDATLLLSIYGARMHIEFLVPHYKKDSYTLKVVCRNSVDGKLALVVNLFLHRVGDAKDIPFDGFHHVHTQELENKAVPNFLRNALDRFLFTPWEAEDIDKKDAVEFIENSNLNPTQQRDLIIIIEKEKRGRVNLLRIREILTLLFDEGEKVFPDQYFVKFAKLMEQLNELVDETATQQPHIKFS